MYFVYIIQSQPTQRYYVGQTDNLDLRLEKHNTDKVKSTKNKGPWKLVYVERYETRAEAVRRERVIKAQKSCKFIEKIIKEHNIEFSQ